MRPVTAATLLVTAGVLAALPFRHPAAGPRVEPSPGLATGPRSAGVDSVAVSRRGEWAEGAKFDPSLAWQPVPMTLPERSSPDLPPMPDSYYDLAFELEQPDPIRQRFSAAVSHRGEPSEPAPPNQPLTGTRWKEEQRGEPISSPDDLITDRFVYTPIELPKPAAPNAEGSRNIRGPQAQHASMTRPRLTPVDDAPRQRQFIREPQ